MIFSLTRQVRELFGHRPPERRPPCQLTDEEALSIARAADPFYARNLAVLLVVGKPTGVEWVIASQSLGHGAYIRIADSTGEVIESSRIGLR